MNRSESAINWKAYSGIPVVLLLLLTIAAIFTNLWVITAIPIGFLFGFFLKKGVVIRAMNAYKLDTFIRVTIGLPKENRAFIRVLKRFLKERARIS